MEGIKSAKLNKTLTSQGVTTHLEVLCSSGGAIRSLIAVPWERGGGTELSNSAGDRRESQPCVFLLHRDPEQIFGSEPRMDLSTSMSAALRTVTGARTTCGTHFIFQENSG